ncbi:TonB-dependent receptor [Aquimarina sp. D1M17]|uniref:SusC/RagA family TonB-linked outer membrane protein n=1 Tax=Aquimarina acroporae TaxID=2937283 RepID=UPI0020BFC12B|nr:TonB-dependent receptor [Aquimarina acroporae]MCK8521139.1 TonB-dependent receptor [Aquimarina acroporae]
MKSMILKRLIFLLVFLSGGMMFAQITVSGVVSDPNGPVPGINVIVKGTNQGASTDFDGKYTIDNVAEDAILVFSYVGFQTQEVAVGGQTTINVTMVEDASELDEVVVVGYGTQSVRDVTGSVASVKAEDFNSGVIASPEELIQGKTAGVQITQTSGEPGAGVNIRIRGTSSVRGNNNPLYVLDGVPLSGSDSSSGTGGADIGGASAKNPLNFLNPSDIASIDILKDASATAIYGSRGANGVVIITTKKGKAGKPILEFSTSISTASVPNRVEVLDRAGFLAAQTALGGDLSVLDQGSDTDWQDLIYRNSFSSNHNVSYGGGTDTGRYLLSLSYSDQEGVVENSGLERITARVNLSQKFFDDKLRLASQITVSDVDDQRAPIADNANARGDLISASYYSNPTLAPYDANGIPTSTGSQEQLNPAALLFYIQDNTNTFRTFANLSAEYEIFEGLTFKTLVGLDKSVSRRAGAYSPDLEMNGVQDLGRAQIDDLNLTTTLWENYFNYNTEIGSNATLDAILGYSFQEFKAETTTLIAADFRNPDPGFMINNIASAQVFGANTTDFTDELQSFYGRVNYSLMGKYLVTATLRADGSTRFGPDRKYGYFPSFALAWRLSEEDFIPSNIFSDLKLRLGYGVTGNQEIPGNLYVQRTRFGTGTIDNGGNFIPGGEGAVTFNNPDLQWEETSQLNVGLDFGFLDNRITGSIDFYRKNTSDLLIQVTSAQPAVTPFVWNNLDADVINQGVEFAINAEAVRTENFTWNTQFNISYNKNEVTNFNEAPINTGQIDGPGLTGAFAQQIADGRPLYAYFLREFTGFDSNGIAQYAGGDVQRFTGDSPLPDFNLGFTNTFKYKNLDLSLFFAGQFGHKIYNNTANALFTVANLSQGRNVSTDTAALIGTEDPFNAGDVSTRFLEDGSFLRLQNVTLGYNFDMNNSKIIDRFRVYANAQNLFVITDYSGQDPEVSVNKQINGVPSIGIDYTAYPRPRTFTLGLNVTF